MPTANQYANRIIANLKAGKVAIGKRCAVTNERYAKAARIVELVHKRYPASKERWDLYPVGLKDHPKETLH